MERLPGLRFESIPSPVANALPRMDVAAFVGFAASGPLHTPVAVEDALQFEEWFGKDLELAWDTQAGRMQSSLLGPAVRDFFQSGGRRCLVVRVAGGRELGERLGRSLKDPETQVFPLGGLLRVNERRAAAPALAWARSAGTWADALKVWTLIERKPLAWSMPRWNPEDFGRRLLAGMGKGEPPFLPGELVRLLWENRRDRGRVECYALARATPENDAVSGIRLESWNWLQSGLPLRPLGRILLPDRDGMLRRLNPSAQRGFAEPADGFEVEIVLRPPALLPQPGMVLPIRQQGGIQGAFLVDRVAKVFDDDGAWVANRYRLSGKSAWHWLVPESLDPRRLRLLSAERLRMGIRAASPDGRQWQAGDLGLSSGHPRAWTRLPQDSQLFDRRPDPQPADADLTEFRNLWSIPRFPLGAPLGEGESLFLPLGLDSPPMGGLKQTREGAELEANGLGSYLPELFFDPELARFPAPVLLEAARAMRDLQGRAPLGLHALAFQPEPSFIAVPDALHAGWTRAFPPRPRDSRREDEEKWLAAPELHAPDADGRLLLCEWDPVAGAGSYLLQEAYDGDFLQVSRSWESANTSQEIWLASGCRTGLHYRVKALGPGAQGLWSATRPFIPASAFMPAPAPPREAHRWIPAVYMGGGWYRLAWEGGDADGRFQVQSAADPDFAAFELHSAEEEWIAARRPEAASGFFRVRVLLPSGVAGPWSATLRLDPLRRLSLRMRTPEEFRDPALGALEDVFRRTHLAMLRLAAARGDMLSLLGLPRSLRSRDAASYPGDLHRDLGADAAGSMGFGAVYHPWLWVLKDGVSMEIPPEGAVAGIISRLSLEQGAWVAAGNQVLPGALGLTGGEGGEGLFVALHASGINWLRQGPRGVEIFSNLTLSPDPLHRPVNVRRLIILIRRLAFREGQQLVFANNVQAVHRQAERLWDRILSGLYRRGALAGDAPAQAFGVRISPESDQGRLVVDLRISPSLPMQSLTVRLIQREHQRPELLEA